MHIIDFHTHLLTKDMVNPTTQNFLEEVNPEFVNKIEEYANDPRLFTGHLRSQGVTYAVILPEYAPATSEPPLPQNPVYSRSHRNRSDRIWHDADHT